MHGHVQALIDEGVDAIFYPSMTYNFDENLGDNHFNCPVVAYYPKVIGGNMKDLADTEYIDDFIAVHNKKEFIIHFTKILALHGFRHNKSDVKKAADAAYECYYSHMESLRKKADEYINIAKEQGLPVIVLCGRPYHADPEINHGLSRIITDLGAIVLTEDSVSCNTQKFDTSVLNQWTYHSRLYAAAKYVADNTDNKLKMNLVQLVSFGCGVDAVTTDETRAILEHKGKIYTQIKIDEISNLGAIKIRLRSLFAVMDKQDASKNPSNKVQNEELVPIK